MPPCSNAPRRFAGQRTPAASPRCGPRRWPASGRGNMARRAHRGRLVKHQVCFLDPLRGKLGVAPCQELLKLQANRLLIWAAKFQYPLPLCLLFTLLFDLFVSSGRIALVEIYTFRAKWIQKTYLLFHKRRAMCARLVAASAPLARPASSGISALVELRDFEKADWRIQNLRQVGYQGGWS